MWTSTREALTTPNIPIVVADKNSTRGGVLVAAKIKTMFNEVRMGTVGRGPFVHGKNPNNID
jgi:hypothetical protein